MQRMAGRTGRNAAMVVHGQGRLRAGSAMVPRLGGRLCVALPHGRFELNLTIALL